MLPFTAVTMYVYVALMQCFAMTFVDVGMSANMQTIITLLHCTDEAQTGRNNMLDIHIICSCTNRAKNTCEEVIYLLCTDDH